METQEVRAELQAVAAGEPRARRRQRERLRLSLRDWEGSRQALQRALDRLVAPPE